MFHMGLFFLDPAVVSPLGMGGAVGLPMPVEGVEPDKHEQYLCLCPLDRI